MEKVMTNVELTKAVNALLDTQIQTQQTIKNLIETLKGLIELNKGGQNA